MRYKQIAWNILFLFSFLLAACGGKPDAMMEKPTAEAMMDKPTEEAMMAHETVMPDAMAKPTEDAMEDTGMESPAWFSAALTNVHDGSAFTIQGFKGKVVLVETMAIWCPKCKQQQGQVKELHSRLSERDDFVSLGLDIDPNETADDLKSYVGANGFSWHYAVASAEVAREIASLYGDQFLNPTATPMLIIDRKGAAHPLPFGIKSADELLQALQPFLDEAM